MGEGLPLPWPYPWSFPGNATLSRAEQLTQSVTAPHLQAASSPFIDTVEAEARKLRQKFGATLPSFRGFELYLIEGIAEVAAPDGNATAPKTLAVVYPPELLFVLDVGLDCRVGGTVMWQPAGYGDPLFPEQRPLMLRSILGTTPGNLIFPRFAGELIIGIREGTSENEAREGLSKHGIQDVEFHQFFATGKCRPFEEPTICKQIESSLGFVKYAESNLLQRLIDFKPGWFAKRLI